MIIIFDTETSGLLAPRAAAIEHQPHMVEIVAVKLDNFLGEIDKLLLRMKPPIPMEAGAIKVHGITDDMVADLQPFAFHYNRIAKFFVGCDYMVGHNIEFDKDVLWYELVRMGKQRNFPFAPGGICTVEVSQHIAGRRLSLTELHEQLFGEGFVGAHSAFADVQATLKCFRELVKMGHIVL